ncbi:MAG: chemotaxis protein CheA [Pseudomonadales bacterium]|nr:chemotaxis protein CheA [Pseudomonadales bacterium]
MAFEADEEILQDFLVEAGEILELLSEQLVDLERNPEDRDLLNAIFRGFHTVKGGAGFLQLDALVDCCHVAENVFDILRNGKRPVTSELMDVVLQALDAVNEMFEQVRNREEPSAADPELLHALELLATPAEAGSASTPAPPPEPQQETVVSAADVVEASGDDAGDITDDEFEQLLDALDGPANGNSPQASQSAPEAPPPPASSAADDIDLFGMDDEPVGSSSDDEITEEEFEKLLDELHGPGKHAGAPGAEEAPAATVSPASASVEASGDDITDDEFERLLDDLHGVGKFGAGLDEGAVQNGSTSQSAPPPSGAAGKASSGDDLITDDEFENLLDELHGSGKGPTRDDATTESAASSSSVSPPVRPQGATPGKASAPVPSQSSVPAQNASADKAVAPAANRGAPPKPPAKEASIATETTVRVDTKRLDDIMNMVGELVLVRNRLKRLGDEIADESMQKAVSNLDVVTGDLQSAVMQTRMQPIKKVFGRFPRVVRDLARNLKKEVNLILRGEDTDLDKNLVEALSDPLVHLVRNAVDHGIEAPDVRENAGKARTGRVILSAEQEGDHILLSIEDDGAGMDPDVLRRKAVEKGLYDADAADRLTDNECFNLIFAPGFSTKDQISDVSGRGVGMDVVKTKIAQLNGTLNIDSELGRGSRIIIKVPLTLAIMPTLMVMLENQSFAFPLVSVVEIFHLDITRTNVVDGQECVVVRDKVYPLFHIKRWLIRGMYTDTNSTTAHVVIVSVGTKRVGFVVDQLIGQEEVVIKPLGKMLHGTPGMAGATITGDGRIALILDIPSLLQRYA